MAVGVGLAHRESVRTTHRRFQTTVLALWPFLLSSGWLVFPAARTIGLHQADLSPPYRYFAKLIAKIDFWCQSGIWNHSDSIIVHWVNKHLVWCLLVLAGHLEIISMQNTFYLKLGFLKLIVTLF